MQKDLRRLMLDSSLLPSEKQDLLSKISVQAASMGMPCYLVGGFVRDLLLGRPVIDFDIVVVGDAIKLGNVLIKKYGGKFTLHTKFRTAIWHLPETWNLAPDTLDLITARSELYEHPGALPTIKPSTIEADLLRRDFTVNAMAVRVDDDHFGEMIDPLNGQNDLERGLIRVLHPQSFMDDPTRIFRAIRYESRYEFKIEPDTLKLINQESLGVLSKLSGERIRHEFDLIFEEETPARMLSRLHKLGIFSVFNPSLPKFNDQYSGLLNSKPPADFGILGNQILLGYLLWMMDSHLNAIEMIGKRLDFSSELTEASLAAVQLKNELALLADAKPSAWTTRLEKIPLMAIYALWLASNEPALKDFLVKWRRIKQKTTGDDLKARGIPPGPRYREILTNLRAAWLDGEIGNEDQEKELLNTLL